MKVIYTDHLGVDQHYATVGTGVLGRGPEGTLRLCRSWLSHLYDARDVRTHRDAVVASARLVP